MDLYRVGLSGRDLKELQHIACRLSLYGEEWTGLDRDSLRRELSKAMVEIPGDDIQRMLGYHLVEQLHVLAPFWKETDFALVLDHTIGMKRGMRVLRELRLMGMARISKDCWKLDPMVNKALAPRSDALDEELIAGDEMLMVLDEILDRFGALPMDVLVKILQLQEEELGPDILLPAVEEIMLCRHGQSALEEWEGRTLLLDQRAMYNESFRKTRQSSLYRKLPYYIEELVRGEEPEEDLLESAPAYQIYALLDPAKSMPKDSSLLKGSIASACRRRIGRSERTRKLADTLASVAYLMKIGNRKDAERLILEQGNSLDKTREKVELNLFAGLFMERCRQWELKGWTIEEVRALPRLSDPSYLTAIGLTQEDPGFQSLCPCGSGKLFRLCHGRGN